MENSQIVFGEENKSLEKTYYFGVSINEVLVCKKDAVQYARHESDGSFFMIDCRIFDKTMKVVQWNKPNKQLISLDDTNALNSQILDLNDDGDRWEGSILDDKPFGYGKLYNELNVVMYQGFLFEGMKYGYGEEFYPDSKTLFYKGSFVHDQRHGSGSLYDKTGEKIYSGDWAYGSFEKRDISISDTVSVPLHNLVKNLIIGDECLNDWSEFIVENYDSLCLIDVGDSSLQKVKKCVINKCNMLKSMLLGASSLGNTFSENSFSVSNCQRLEEIVVGEDSALYKSCVLKSNLLIKVLNRSSKSKVFLCG